MANDVASRLHFGCYSLVRTGLGYTEVAEGSSRQVPGGNIGRMYV